MTILNAAALLTLAPVVALAGCSPDGDYPIKHEDGATAAKYRRWIKFA